MVPGKADRSSVLRAAELGIVDYGHRATPDVYLNSALSTKGVWNSSQYSSKESDAAFTAFQSSVGVDAQKAACGKIEAILVEDTAISVPYFYNYLDGLFEEVHRRLLERPRPGVLLDRRPGLLTAAHGGDDRTMVPTSPPRPIE